MGPVSGDTTLIMTHSTLKFSMMTLSIPTVSIMTFSITINQMLNSATDKYMIVLKWTTV